MPLDLKARYERALELLPPALLPVDLLGVCKRLVVSAWRASVEAWAAGVAVDAGRAPDDIIVFRPRSPRRDDVVAELAEVCGCARSTAARYVTRLGALGIVRRFGRHLLLDVAAAEQLGRVQNEHGDVQIEHGDVQIEHADVQIEHAALYIPPRTIQSGSRLDPYEGRARARGGSGIPEDVGPLIVAVQQAHRHPGPISEIAARRLAHIAGDEGAARAVLGAEWTRAAWIARLIDEVQHCADATLPVSLLAARITRLVENAGTRRGQAVARPGGTASSSEAAAASSAPSAPVVVPDVVEDPAAAAAWAPVAAELRRRVTAEAFETYFAPLAPVGQQAGRVQITAGCGFLLDWIRAHYTELIDEAARVVGVRVGYVEPEQVGQRGAA